MATREALDNLTNAELIRHTDNTPDASPLARELANRLYRAITAQENATYPDQRDLYAAD